MAKKLNAGDKKPDRELDAVYDEIVQIDKDFTKWEREFTAKQHEVKAFVRRFEAIERKVLLLKKRKLT